MPLKKNRERIVNNPLENRNVGRRTGKNITAGKNIRKVAGGFENFDDYWSESEADMTREVTFVKPSTPMDVTAMKKGEACDVRSQQPSLAPPVKHLDSQSSVLVQSQAGNIEPGRDALNPFTSKQIGRRTWKDMKAGKNIRVFDGFENFDDYWSESDAESVASFCTTTSNKSKADKKSSVPSKTSSNTDTREEKQKSSNNETYGNKKDSSRVSGTFGDKTDTGKTGKDQMKTAVTSLHNQETNKESPPQDDQTEVSSTEETYSQESSTLAKDVDSQEEKDTEEDSGQEGTQGQQTDNAEEVLEEEYSQEEKLAKTRGKPDNINLEPPKEIPVSDKGKEIPNEKRQKKRSKSNLFTELHTDSTADSKPGTSTKKTSVGATSQECTTLAVEESGSSRKAKLCESSSKQPKSPAKEESKQTNSKLEAKKFKGNTTLETSDARERAVESSFDEEGSEQSEETPQSHKGSEQKEKVSGSGAKKLRVSEQKTDPKEKGTQAEKKKPSASQQVSDPQDVSSGHDVMVRPSTSDHSDTGTSQSQMSGAESPQAVSQKSSVYLSIAGDITGSITHLSSKSVLSPEPRLYGTRRRSRVPQPVCKTSTKKVVSSPIPEDHKESAEHEEEDLVPSSQSDNPEDDEILPTESAENKEEDLIPSLQSDNPEDVEILPTQLVVKKGSSKQQKTNPALAKLQQNAQVNSDPSQNSPSEMGTFVSLASQTQTRLSTTLVAASSSDFEDVFEIMDESKVYRAPVGHPKSVRARSEKSKDRGKKKAESKKGSSSEEAGNCSPEEDKTQHRETNISAGDKKITKRSLSFDEADGRQSPGNALAKVKKKKARKDASNVKENQLGTAEAEDADTESLEKRSGSKEREKSISKKKGQRNVKENHPETAEVEDVDTGSMDKRSGSKEREKSISKKKGQRNVKGNHPETAEVEDVDTGSMDKRGGNKEREKSISKKKGQGSGMESQDSKEERPVMTKKIKKGKGNMFSDVNKTVPSAASRWKSPTSKEKQTRKALEKPSSAFDVDDDHDKSPSVEPETQHQKAAVKNKSKRSSSKLAEQGTSEENTTEEEPLVPESAANSESSDDHRRVQKTKKSRSKNIAEEEHLAQETASVNRSSTQYSPARKTRTQAKQDRQAIPVEQEQKRRKRGKRSTKSEAELSNLEEKVHSVKPSKRGKKGLGDSAHGVSPAKKVRRASTAVDQEDAESLEENEGENYTPGGQTLADMSIGDSALKSGISFRRFTHVPSSLKTGRSRQLTYSTSEAPEEDIISSPAFATLPRQSSGASLHSSRPQPTPDSTPVGGYLHRKVNEDSARRKKERRVTICDNVTFRSFSPEEKGEDNSMLPSMSATPVHYYQLTAPTSAPEMAWKKNKIVHPDDNTAGLRRSQRTRVKPLEWYKNERIIYDRRGSGPVIMGVEPSREHIYMEQENQRRRKRRQKYLVSKKQQTNKGRLRKRLSTHLPVPDNMDVTVSTDIPVIHPDTQQEFLLSCFNPAAGASVIGPSGDSPKPDDPFSLTLLTQQNLFTTGVLTLAPASEKPLQRTMSTAVLYFITYGKILVTINRATTILETGDHFFVPRGTVYSLRNLRKEEAVISFTNLMVDQAECEQAENSACTLKTPFPSVNL